MRKLGYIILTIAVLVNFGCKSTKSIVSKGELDKSLSSRQLIKEHTKTFADFKTLQSRVKIDYQQGDMEQSHSVNLRIEKDKTIWLSATLGIVRVKITPTKVSFYNKLENEFFDGDFSYLSNILGTELDFEKVQNLLMGQALFDLREAKYDMDVMDENYQLTPKKSMELFQTLFQIEPKNFKMAAQQLSQPLKKRLLEVNYKDYQKINKWVLPNTVLITAIDGNTKNTIDIEYRNIEFDQQISFPYKIPKGYKEIVLNKNDI